VRDDSGTVLVTGGSSGLGAAIAAELREDGFHPVVLDRQPPADGFDYREVDLAHPRDAEAAVRAEAESNGGLAAVVTAAGIDACGDLLDVDADDWDRVVMVFDDRPEQFKPAPDQQLNDPRDVARSVVFALRQPPGCELRELLVAPATEPSWP
jgi:NADP-dependent 3-hydroxy acid dehydrogenase YdfG